MSEGTQVVDGDASTIPPRNPRRPRLTMGLRGFMILVLVLGLVLHWIYTSTRQHDDVLALRSQGGRVIYSWQWEKRNLVGFLPYPPSPGFFSRAFLADCFGDVVAVDLSHGGFDPSDVRRVAHFRRLRELIVHQTPINDRDLLALASLTQLEHLELQGTEIRGPGLRALSGMTKLKTLKLDIGLTMDDDEFGFIKGLRQLRELEIDAERLTDKGFRHLSSLHEMRDLWMMSAEGASNAGFSFLGEMPELMKLEMLGTKISDLSLLRHNPNLRSLRVFGPPAGLEASQFLDREDLESLRSLPRLNTLVLGLVRIKDDDLVALESLDGLVSLSLPRDGIRGPGLIYLARMKGLRDLDLGSNPIGDEYLGILGKSTSIRHLSLRNTKATGAGLLTLKSLKTLTRVDCPRAILDDVRNEDYRRMLPGVILHR